MDEIRARFGGASPAAIAALGGALFLLHALAAGVERHLDWTAPVQRDRMDRHAVDIQPDGTLRASAADDLHLIQTLVEFGRFGKFHDYDVRFDVLEAASANVVLHVDFFAAPDYDLAGQERSVPIDVESLGTRVALRINSGWAPRQAYLRVFYYGPPGVVLGEVHLRQVPLAWTVLQRGLQWLGVGLLLLAAWLALVRRMGSPALCTTHEPPEANAGSTLVAIYLTAVLAQLACHLFAPLWLGDELQYKTMASLMWWRGTDVPLVSRQLGIPVDLPGRLYPYLISPAFEAGAQFYSAVRLLNALLMSAVVFPTYAIGRRCLPRGTALFVAALSAAIPFVHLSAYAMTEVVFFPLYVGAAWLTLESLLQPGRLAWSLGAGCAAALAFCTRPSGVVVLPAFLICQAWVAWRSGAATALERRPRWLVAPAAFLVVYPAVQWLTGARAQVSPGLYAPALEQRGELLANALARPDGMLDLALGHLTTLSIPFALPLALLFCTRARRSGDGTGSQEEARELLRVIAVVFFLALLALTLLFTVLVSGTDLGGLGRWHSRYYFHAYPLLMLAFAASLATPVPDAARRTRRVALAVGLLIIANVWFMNGRAAATSVWFYALVDHMDAHWYAVWGILRWPLLAATLLLTWLWYRDDRWLRPVSVALATLWIAVANLGTLRTMYVGGLASDPCGKLTTSFLELQPGRFAIIGTTPVFRGAASFWSPYLPLFSGTAADTARYLAGPEATQLDFIVSDQSASPDPRFELRVDGGACRIYARRR